MILYEVNLSVEDGIREPYLTWLKSHVQEMLTLDGFVKADIFRNATPEDGRSEWVVHYWLNSRDELEKYFAGAAHRMRQDGLNRFGQRFRASRRVLEYEAQ